MAHNTHRGQTRITLQFTVDDDLTNAVLARVHYRKPNSREGYFIGTITDPLNGVVDYPVTSSGDLDDSGIWTFWVEAYFNDNTTAVYDPVTIYIYEPGEKYIHYPYGTTSLSEGEISMPTEAFRILYDNSVTGLSADNVQSALDEINQKIVVLSANNVSYLNTASDLAATNVQAAIDELNDNFQKEKIYTVGTLFGDYETIQEAIDAAVAAGHNVDDPAVVTIRPKVGSNYSANDLVLAAGVHLRGLLINNVSTVVFEGEVKAEFSNADDFTSIYGMTIESKTLNALKFEGTETQKLFLEKCRLVATGSGKSAINMSNTGSGSEVIIEESDLVSETGSTLSTMDVSAGTLKLFRSSVLGSDSAVGAAQISGTGKVIAQYTGLVGPVFVTDNGIYESFVTSMEATGAEVFTNNSDEDSVLYAVQIDCDQSPVIVSGGGSGVTFASLVSYKPGSEKDLGSDVVLIEMEGKATAIKTGISEPANPKTGDMFFDTASDEIAVFNGTAWVRVTLL